MKTLVLEPGETFKFQSPFTLLKSYPVNEHCPSDTGLNLKIVFGNETHSNCQIFHEQIYLWDYLRNIGGFSSINKYFSDHDILYINNGSRTEKIAIDFEGEQIF